MEGMARKPQGVLERVGPSGLDKFQIVVAAPGVEFVANHRSADMGEVYADLMGAACFRKRLDKREWPLGSGVS